MSDPSKSGSQGKRAAECSSSRKGATLTATCPASAPDGRSSPRHAMLWLCADSDSERPRRRRYLLCATRSGRDGAHRTDRDGCSRQAGAARGPRERLCRLSREGVRGSRRAACVVDDPTARRRVRCPYVRASGRGCARDPVARSGSNERAGRLGWSERAVCTHRREPYRPRGAGKGWADEPIKERGASDRPA